MSGRGVWAIEQGGTGLTTSVANSIAIINSSSQAQLLPTPVKIAQGGLGNGVITGGLGSFITTTASTTDTSVIKPVPLGGPIGVDSTTTFLNKSLGTGTVFTASPAMNIGFVASPQYSITSTVPSSQKTYTVQDMGANSNFLFTQGSQTLKNKTITDATNNVAAKSLRTTGTSVTMGGSVAPTVDRYLTYDGATSTSFFEPPFLRNIWTMTVPVSFSGTTTTTSIIGATGAGTTTIPANTLAVGDQIRIGVRGFLNNQTVNPLTLTLSVWFGGVQFQSIALSTNASSITMFYIDATICIRTSLVAWNSLNICYGSNGALNSNRGVTTTTTFLPTTTIANAIDVRCGSNITGTWTVTGYVATIDYLRFNP